MKKFKKKELLEIVSTLIEVNETIESNNNLDESAVLNTLADCQETALTIGNSIEEHYENTTDIIRMLETYCEDIYHMSMAVSDVNQCQRMASKIQKKLVKLVNQIKYDLPEDRKEIVFLPYKASMWDSLESVWKRAAANPEYDVYVVPIPYYDKNSDGSLGDMHYEGNEYPDYVPITSFEEYIISEQKPDEIYIHNPYDGYNKVTTVHPAFYASELRKYTNMLVYIPYFVAVNDKVERHFCTTAGVLYAHKVIVQSEKVRDIYLEELHKYEEEFDCKGAMGNLEEKIVAGGSPKYDKVIEAKLEDFDIPKEWTQLIVKEDGNRRKVVLYNTSIKAILTYPEKVLNKIENVFKIFKNNPDVILLWRPHPLLKSTIQSMRKEFVERYEQIENSYKEEGWGIYDDTADMYRAITLSDAYYGDCSSVVELYKKTNKLIMIQNFDIQ